MYGLLYNLSHVFLQTTQGRRLIVFEHKTTKTHTSHLMGYCGISENIKCGITRVFKNRYKNDKNPHYGWFSETRPFFQTFHVKDGHAREVTPHAHSD